MFDYTLIKYKKTVWLPASDWSCRVVSLGFFVMKQERPGMMHLKNVTKNSWLLLRPAFEPREERALRGSGRVATAGPGPGRCLWRRGKEDPEPAGRCPGRDELLKAGSSSPRSPSVPLPPGAHRGARADSPPGAADAKGWRARVGLVRGSRARETEANVRPTHLPSRHGVRRAQPPSAGIRPPGGRMGRALRLKPPSPRRSTRGPGGGAEPRSRLGDLLANGFTSYLSPDCSEESWFWLEILMTWPHSQRVAALASLFYLPFCSRKTLFSWFTYRLIHCSNLN